MTTPLPNPFVGPRPLRRGEPLHGRADDIQRTVADLIAHRVVVLHSAAGAGKTSLIHAGLMPTLERSNFDVWKPIRLNPDLSGFAGLPERVNPYLLSAMLSLEDELPADSRRSPAELAGLRFADYVATRPRRKRRAEHDIVLVFDSLDEVLRDGNPDDACKREFFEVVGDTLMNHKYWALLVVRDELLAKLTLFHRYIPSRLANTIHIAPFKPDVAREVIEALAGEGGRSFAELDALVHELCLVRDVGEPDGAGRRGSVEPLQLQVVCRRLWAATPSQEAQVDSKGIGVIGDLTDTLARYYAAALRKLELARQRDVRERIARTLIVHGRCPMVREASVELEDAIIDRLLTYNLVQRQDYGGGAWLVLAHERLADAILQDNHAFARTNSRSLSMLQTIIPPWSKHAPRARPESAADGEDGFVESEATFLRSGPHKPASEQSWLFEPSKPRSRNAGDPELVSQLAGRLLDIDAPRHEALLGVALTTLALTDPAWLAAAKCTAANGFSREACFEHLRARLSALAEAELDDDIPSGAQPTLADLITALLELGDALARARGPDKRELLLAAFRAGLSPDYFGSGMGRHLWELSCRLELAELWVLDAIANERGYEPAAEHEFLLGRLAELGLLSRAGEQGSQTVCIDDLAWPLLSFLRVGGLSVAEFGE